MSKPMQVPLLVALLLLLGAALVASLVPAGLALDRRVTSELRRTGMADLGRAPIILDDRNAARAEALAMHAMSVAGTEGLMEAVGEGRFDEAVDLARATASMYGEQPVIVAPDGSSVIGPALEQSVLDALRSGDSRVEYVYEDGMPQVVGVVGLMSGADWMGAAGSASLMDESQTTVLAGLARADVTIVGADGTIVASTLDTVRAERLVQVESALDWPTDPTVVELSVDDVDSWVTRGELAGAGTVIFSRDVDEELASLPTVRRGALLAGLLTLVLALGVGSVVALALTRPVGGLALAADRVAEGDFDAPIPSSRVNELERLGSAFRSMRRSLESRLHELADANQELEQRQDRLHELQAELIRQDRVASSARMAAELAHEIRNPVANVRNCLEVVRRSMPADGEGMRFTDMAIDELLRMHELAEHLLDLNRPADPGAGTCRPSEVAAQVATLAQIGGEGGAVRVRTEGEEVEAAMPPDGLKQILFNLIDNAREATSDPLDVEVRVSTRPGTVVVDVLDRGPGIEEDVLPQVFDPFFTTKEAVSGVGLGLSVAQGIARRHGGRMEAANRTDGPGARFRIELPRAQAGQTGAGGDDRRAGAP